LAEASHAPTYQKRITDKRCGLRLGHSPQAPIFYVLGSTSFLRPFTGLGSTELYPVSFVLYETGVPYSGRNLSCRAGYLFPTVYPVLQPGLLPAPLYQRGSHWRAMPNRTFTSRLRFLCLGFIGAVCPSSETLRELTIRNLPWVAMSQRFHSFRCHAEAQHPALISADLAFVPVAAFCKATPSVTHELRWSVHHSLFSE
jgi:hypothetical protein